MQRIALIVVCLLIVPGTIARSQEEIPEPAQEAAEETPPMSPQEVSTKASYGLGLQMGRNFKYQEFDPDLELLIQGVKDGLAGAQPQFDEGQIQAALQASRVAAAKAIAVRNRALGEAFLKANAMKQGVFALPSGLQYRVIRDGDGPKPTVDDRVVVHYRTILVDGTEVEDTFREEKPRTVAVNGLIPAWVEALQLMPVGSRWQLWVPPDLAHGDRGSGQIGPGATSIFVIELVEIAPPEPFEPAEPEGSG